MPQLDNKSNCVIKEAFYVPSPLTGGAVAVGPIVDLSGNPWVTISGTYYTLDSVGSINLDMTGFIIEESDDPLFATFNEVAPENIIGDISDFVLEMTGVLAFAVYTASVGLRGVKRYVRCTLDYLWTGSTTPPPHFIGRCLLYPSVTPKTLGA